MTARHNGWDHLLSVRHLRTLVDDTGILQHARGSAPNLSEGYCVDDVARLAIVAAGMLQRRDSEPEWRMLNRSLSFLDHASAGDGMHNFMSFQRQWLDDPYIGDHVGRAAWALGDVLRSFPDVPSVAIPAARLLERLEPVMGRVRSVHEWAYCVLGLARLPENCWSSGRERLARTGAGILLARLQAADPHFPWFADKLTYDNARAPMALAEVGHRLGEASMVDAGLGALEWLWGVCDRGDHVQHVGHLGATSAEDAVALAGDEQPVDAGALVEACISAWEITSQEAWKRRAALAFGWFVGKNRLGLSLRDPRSGGCHDGLGREALNDNQGAESTLALLQAALAMERAGLRPPEARNDGRTP